MKYFLTIFLFSNSVCLFSQTILWEEDFEDVDNLSLMLSNRFHDGCNDHFDVTDGSNICLSSCDDSDYTNYKGTYFWAGEDLDDAGGEGDQLNIKVMTSPEMNIENYGNITFSGLFGAGNNCGDGNSAYDSQDYINVYYVLNKTDTTLLISFQAENNTDQTNEPLAQDTDLDGIGDGIELGTTLQSFSGDLKNGETLQIIIEIHMDSDKEEIAFDAFTVEAIECIKPEFSEIVVEQNNTCPGTEVILSVSNPTLNDANNWYWYQGNCDSTPIGEGETLTIHPENSTSYFVRGEGNCVDGGKCHTIDITIEDTSPPQVEITEQVEFYLDESCEGKIPDLSPLANISDNCSNTFDIEQTPAPGIAVTSEQDSILFEVWDLSGNKTISRVKLNAIDTIPPVIEGTEVLEVYTNSKCSVFTGNLMNLFEVQDNCSIDTLIQSIPSDSLLSQGKHEFFIKAIDEYGNELISNYQLQVLDTIKPSIMAPEIISSYKNEKCLYIMEDFTDQIEYDDNCEITENIVQDPEPGTPIPENEFIVSFTVSDMAGNTTSAISGVVVSDTLKPKVDYPETISLSLNNCTTELPDISKSVAISDNCSDDIYVSQEPTAGTIIHENSTILGTATDSAGNMSSFTIQVLVVDEEPPAVECPDNIELPDNQLIQDFTNLVEVFDKCGEEVRISQFPEEGSSPDTVTSLVFTVTDTAENTASCKSTFTLITAIDKPPISNIEIYPNPSAQKLFIENARDYSLKVFNPEGKLINHFKIGEKLLELQTGHLKKGIYYLFLSKDKDTFIEKILVR